MITLCYSDAYQIERKQVYDTPDAFMLALSGCVTLPDSTPILSVTYKEEDLGYKGIFGDLYKTFSSFDWSVFD
ncbi:DUF4649 family protein [Streptococcus sciuri]|uniref:DUF4649 family protein n=1 Tax=Streptococcus sciuri TaxID=2973939 RepID=A0ABT2F4Q1_9STRE|nr:DUF4649 family protein [Streptococcus sciuri]MCS4487446.1 DUF4649 family protein [Streptococcus sciuri]